MNYTTSGIAVAVALVLVAAFFIFPGYLPFTSAAPSRSAVVATAPADSSTTTNNPQQLTTMPPTPAPANPNQLQASDEVVGTGATAAAGDTITVNYVGALTDGTVFDASANHGSTGFTFTLGAGQVIPGWDQGIVGMKVGGTRKLYIPAALAYGSSGVGNVIPPNSALVFEVQLVAIKGK